MSESGVNSIAKDLKDAADKENLFIARERCEFINRCVLANVAVTTRTTTTLYDVKKLSNDSEQQPKKTQTTTALSKSSMARTKKLVVSMPECSKKSSDDEQDDDRELTPKLDRLRPRTVVIGAKELASNPCKSSMSTPSNEKKRKRDKTVDERMKRIPKKKKPRCAAKEL